MGNMSRKKLKSTKGDNSLSPGIGALPTYTKAWNLLYSGKSEQWETIAGKYGMDMYAYDCKDIWCSRDNVCVQYFRVNLKRNKKFLELERYKKSTLSIPISDDFNYYLINQYILQSNAATQRSDLLLLTLNCTDDLCCKLAFPLVNLTTESIVGILESPHKTTTVIHCVITPDLSHTAIIFYHSSSNQRKFCYDLNLYSNERMEIVKTYTLNHEVQPYISLDPRYKWSRAAVANYESREEGIKHELVLFSLDSGKVCKRSNLSLPSLFGSCGFNLLYNVDGTLLILQKLTEDRFGVTSYSDIYLFSSDQLRLIKYVTASLPGFHLCKVNFEPMFSNCGSYMRILDYKSLNEDQGITVQIYQLPRHLNLSSQCRLVILQNIEKENICALPLPTRLKDYLNFQPMWN